jgi:hypothetical protein
VVYFRSAVRVRVRAGVYVRKHFFGGGQVPPSVALLPARPSTATMVTTNCWDKLSSSPTAFTNNDAHARTKPMKPPYEKRYTHKLFQRSNMSSTTDSGQGMEELCDGQQLLFAVVTTTHVYVFDLSGATILADIIQPRGSTRFVYQVTYVGNSVVVAAAAVVPLLVLLRVPCAGAGAAVAVAVVAVCSPRQRHWLA